VCKPSCKWCGSTNSVKNGIIKGRQRYRCRGCGRNFVEEASAPSPPPSKPEAMKALSLLLYGMGNASFRMIGRLLQVSASTVVDWVRDKACAIPDLKVPSEQQDTIIILDEMHHFIQKKSNKLWLWRAYDPATSRVCAWVTGGRDDKTLKELLAKIGMKGRIFFADDWEGYHRVIPEAQLYTGKDLTVPLERDNSNIRHYLSRFRRRTKVVSKSKEMVDFSLRLLHHLQEPDNYAKLAKKFLSVFSNHAAQHATVWP
jgi:insertion element IS1 protein InsB